MAINRFVPLSLAILITGGLAASAYLFGQEEIQNAYNQLVNPPSKTQEPGPLSEETLYQSLLSAPIDWNTQMNELKEEGFNSRPFIADIIEFDVATKSLTLQFDYNYGGDFPQVEEIVTKSTCVADKSYIISSLNLQTIAEKTDIFAFTDEKLSDETQKIYIEPDDILISYCLDDSCSKIGQECVLVKID